ncbi:MAG: hypothetical protein ACLFWL_05160 [Candidatus Brocadiia bacterium]
MRHPSRLMLVIIVAAGFFLPSIARAGSGTDQPHPELLFALELERMGYGDFAVDQLVRTRTREFVPKLVRIKASKWLGEICKNLAEKAEQQGRFPDKKDYHEKAIKWYGKYLSEHQAYLKNNNQEQTTKHREEYALVRYERGTIGADLGGDAIKSMKGTTDEEEKLQYKSEAIDYFGQAVEDLKKGKDYLVKWRKQIDEGAKSDAQKELLHQIRQKAGRAQMQYGQALYEYARLWEGEKKKKEHDKKLKEAIEVFKSVADYYRLFAIRYKAYRQMGLSYCELGDFKKSVEYLNKALSVSEIPDTIWIIRLALFNLAQTYNAWGKQVKETKKNKPGEWGEKYSKADIACASGIQKINKDIWQKEVQGTGTRDLRDMLFAFWLEKGTANVGHSLYMLTKAEDAKKKKRKVLYKKYQDQAKREFRWAVEKAMEVSKTRGTRWSRNAEVKYDKWLEMSKTFFPPDGIKIRPNIHTYMAEGRRLFENEKYMECIPKFQEAIKRGSAAYYKTLLPEAWYQMGVAYYNLSKPAHTGGQYTYYYEAGLCFDHIVDKYEKANFASDAAYYGAQIYGAIYKNTREKVSKGYLQKTKEMTEQLADDALRYDGVRYYRALHNFIDKFPDDPRRNRTRFQVAELARTLENYREASTMYAKIKKEHPKFYEARYRAGLCLYLQSLKSYEETVNPRKEDRRETLKQEIRKKREKLSPEDLQKAVEEKLKKLPEIKLKDVEAEKLGELMDRAVTRYQDFIAWFDNNKTRLGVEGLQTANKWVARTKVSLGKLLIHKVWGLTHDAKKGAEQALEVLQDVRSKHFEGAGRDKLREDYLPKAYMVIIQAYRRLDKLGGAEKFVDGLVKEARDNPGNDNLKKIASQACSLLGYAYLQRRKDYEKEGPTGIKIRDAAEKAGTFLQKALTLDPEQDITVYRDTASQLYQLEEYKHAVRLLEEGLNQYKIDEDKGPTGAQQDVLVLLEDCYLQMEDWFKVEEKAKELLEIEKAKNEKREAAGEPLLRNVDFRYDLAFALENQENYDEAVEWWREVKTIAKNMEGAEGEKIKFQSTTHLAKSYAAGGRIDRGYKILAWYLIASAEWLSHTDWKNEIERLFDLYFPDKYGKLKEYTFNKIRADKKLLLRKDSRKIIDQLVNDHWPEEKKTIEQWRKEVGGELGTGE